MSIEQHEASARRLTEETWSGKTAVLDDVVAPDFVGHQPGGRTISGRAAYKAFVAGFHAALPDFRVAIEDQIAEGDRVVTRWSARGTHLGSGQLPGPCAHRQRDLDHRHEHRPLRGRQARGAVEQWSNWDALGLLHQLGLVPPLE